MILSLPENLINKINPLTAITPSITNTEKKERLKRSHLAQEDVEIEMKNKIKKVLISTRRRKKRS